MKRLTLFPALLLIGVAVAQNPVTIDVATIENQVSNGIYGACIEDVNHEIYGGLYDQKIFGESFEEDYQNITFNEFDTYGGNWLSVSATQVSVAANDGAKLLHHTPLTDGSVEVEIKFAALCESAAFIVRTTNAQTGADNFDGYEIGLNALTHEIILGKHVHNWQSLGNTPVAFNANEWTKLRVELTGARIRIYVNDSATPNVDYTDTNMPLLSGKIGVRTWRSDVSFRNLRIKTGTEWENLSFDGVVTQSGMWDILREGNTAQFSLDADNAFNGKYAQKIVYDSGNGKAGLINGGLNRWGIAVQSGKTYNGRLYLRSLNFTGKKVYVALQSVDGQSIYAQQELENTGVSWEKFPFSLTSNATDSNARFVVWIENEGTVWLDQVVLESPAADRFYNLPFRADIGNAMVTQGLNFVRYGGTMVNAAEYRFKKMIGNPDLRPPYRGHWYPYSTNGFGIEDFLKFCEAAGFEAAFAINIEETAQDAADMVEYLNGDVSTVWGAKRAENGHPAPYNVKYIEIGNEEILFNGDVAAEYTHYIERFNDLYAAMKAKDPHLKFINAAWWRPESPNVKRVFDALNGKADYWDYHEWTDDLSSGRTVETELRKMQSLFKQWDANTTMKCAIFEENGNTHNLQRAITHASVLNAVRRMGDFVLTSCAANALQPYRQNDNGWDQGQIFFTPAQVWGQPTYYAQQMAAGNHLPLRIKQTSRGLALDVTATTDKNRQSLVIHVVNTDARTVSQAFVLQNFKATKTAKITVLSGSLNDENTPEQPEKITPQTSEITIENAAFTYTFQPHSYTIIRIETSEVTTSNYSQVDLKMTWDAESTISGSSRVLFGVLLPEGWRTAGKGDFDIRFSNSNRAGGQFAFCQFYTDYLAKNCETPTGYYWWGGRAIDKISFSSRVQFDIDFSLKVFTDKKSGSLDLKYAAGDDPSNTIRQHFVSTPFQVKVYDNNEFPAEKIAHWEQVTGNFDTKYYRDKDFDGYFQRYYGWNGGDVGISTLLPDGRSIWTWGDYDVGVVDSQRNRLRELNQFPRNGLTVQENDCDFSAFRLLTNGKNAGQIEPAIVYRDNANNPRPDDDEWYWPMGGHIYYRNGVPELQVLLEHTVDTGGEQWDMRGVSTDVAVFSLPGLQLVNVAKDRYVGEIGFGNIAFRDDDGTVYVYGERNWGICVGSTFVARNTDGDLTGNWEFYNGVTHTWSRDYAWQNLNNWQDYAIMHKPFFVFKDGGKYFAFEQEPCFSPNSYVYDAESPIGPFTNRRLAGVLPAEITSNNFICYIPTLHQQFSKDGELLYSISKNYNGNFDRYGSNQSANYYLPYFFRVKNWRDKLNIVHNDITADGGNFSAQGVDNPENSSDKNENTFCSAASAGGGQPVWIQYKSERPLFLRRYTITSAPGSPEKDPLHWQVLGSNDNVNWTVLDERYYAAFEERGQTNSYTIPIDRTMQYFRLNILAANGSNGLQIAEWQLFGQYVDFDYQGNTAVRKTEIEKIKIYPNPVKDEIIIDNGNLKFENETVQITDLYGKTVINQKIPSLHSSLSINVSALSVGIYVLKIGSFREKFIKK